MKTISKFTIIALIILGQNAYSQGPVFFPDGIVAGPTSISIPAGSNYKLAVSGGILTEKVRIAGSTTIAWADFVFDQNYKLMPIKEVAKFIKENKHLPAVPTTEQVKTNGVDLAETQALLLQKIEELTLYMIQQNRKIEYLERKINKRK